MLAFSISRWGKMSTIINPRWLESDAALTRREYGVELPATARGCSQRAIYLDANATAPPLEAVVDAVRDVMQSNVGHPASAHRSGAAARRFMETGRDRVSELVPCSGPENIIFVSGGTEANNIVIGSFVQAESVTFLAALIEHSSVLEPLRIQCPNSVLWL